jgi:hypothetical protein
MDQATSTDELEPGAEPAVDWYFTFGHGQRGYSANSHGEPAVTARGFPLWNRYVVIHGTYESARDEMFRVFGPIWSMQYESREAACVDAFDLIELVIADATPAPGRWVELGRAAFCCSLLEQRAELQRALSGLNEDELAAVYLAAHDLATATTAHQIDRFGLKPMAAPEVPS